ncbi:hypothetical protein HIM_09145 [Hirsutella minnesotensis 3608]|uniref:Carrier domain-containing protein n=1 Tax=Hirsutella minnesotensis 3608 TaxID=1043627 RepID=A0A0F8A399_9HYPO|nr:hypothetical protein HIM_09145 [Hirsutella minnesotensis 3608]
MSTRDQSAVPQVAAMPFLSTMPLPYITPSFLRIRKPSIIESGQTEWHQQSGRKVAMVAGMDGQHYLEELPALIWRLYELPPSDIRHSTAFRVLQSVDDQHRTQVLSVIPASRQPSHRPLHLLHTLLADASRPWPPVAIIRCYSRLWKTLPEPVKARPHGDLASLLCSTSKLVKASYNELVDFIRQDSRPALRSSASNQFISYRGLRRFAKQFQLPLKETSEKPVVAIALPNGPLLAATCVAVMNHYIAAPINPATGCEQFRSDVTQAGARFIVTTRVDYEKLQLNDAWVGRAGITVLCVDWDGYDGITLSTRDGEVLGPGNQARLPNSADNISLILFTSGTSGTKKVVPLTLHSIISGVIFVMDSWGLNSSDICLNMMPLYHVGGLVRNILAPIFSGGSTVCCNAFEPSLFWDVVDNIQPTWYYASPSMHTVILAQLPERSASLERSRIRLVCNAAGGLLPSLARQLRDTFDCVVLPSYGMTECMPISTPPLDYDLSREGTSGISAGPELSIMSCTDSAVSAGTIGRICVRGEPIFPGYLLPDGTYDKRPFNPDGWFDTGDLGYMDDDGYLYITGRSKEVINRGGELISPFEVENAIMTAAMTDTVIRGRVSQALAFSASHSVLQEVVAVVLVTPPNQPRVDLKSLHSALQSSLQQVKWPVLITYMDDLPKRNNKVLRIRLAHRLGLPDIEDDTPYLRRHWEAVCPPADTDLAVPIQASPCRVIYGLVSEAMSQLIPPTLKYHCQKRGETYDIVIAPSKGDTSTTCVGLVDEIQRRLRETLHNYMLPGKIHNLPEPMPVDAAGNVDETAVGRTLDAFLGAALHKMCESTEGRVAKVFADILARHPTDIPYNVDFFSLGGDSLRAGRLLSALRSTFHVQLPISIVFNQGTVTAISAFVDKIGEPGPVDVSGEPVYGCAEANSSTNPFVMVWHLIPLLVLYPLRRAFQWTIFIVSLSHTQSWPTTHSVPGRLFNVLFSISLARLLMQCITPFLAIIAKWAIIGRYREGLFPMWGWYHSRWWMVQKIESICGMGLFDLSDSTRRLYARLMGARIGKNVKLTQAQLGEWDLLEIQDNAALTRCICRPFGAEGNTTMYLGRIVVGSNCSVGISSIIAPGTQLPPNTCIGANSSSWEMEDAEESNRDISPAGAPKPHWVLVAFLSWPLKLIAWILSLLPWAGGLVGMVLIQPPDHDTPLRDILDWFTASERVAYHYLALILRTFFSPFIIFAFTILVKTILDLLFGQLKPTSATGGGSLNVWRADLISMLMPISKLHELTSLFGQHYEATSVAFRLLGSKIGKRVYWPGTGPNVGDYHLLEIGNDVVFGSRAHLITSDATGAETINVRDRAMIADRVCLLPGVDIGEEATMGSGALTRRGKVYEAGGIYVGSKGGDAICLSSGPGPTREKCRRARFDSLDSDVTLTGDGVEPRREGTAGRIHHVGSDDTLAESRHSRHSRHDKIGDPFASSDSESEYSGSPPVSKTMSPFGRAFYLKLAPYRVLGQFSIFCYSTLAVVFTAFYWNVPNVSSIQVVDLIMYHFIRRERNFWVQTSILYALSSVVMAILTSIQAILALAIVIAAKWILLGRRQPGNFDWDKSSYCQRWQIFLCIERLRRHCYCGQGILGLLTGTSWIVMYFRALGASIGKDCSLFANGRPSLMFTEPDLITLGDRVVVDDASVVAHINTRGKFDLNKLEIGNRCVLRTGSRLLSGAKMKDESCLLEHTLIMGGDVVEEKWTMQGWPAEKFSSQRVRTVDMTEKQ